MSPNITAVTPVNPVPVMVTTVPLDAGPVLGEMLVTVGRGAYVNTSAAEEVLVPLDVVTLISTTPVAWAGENMVI